MNTSWLEYLLVIKQVKSINLAAKKLYMSRQGLNKAITSLEKELGIKLLERNHTGVQLTPNGEIVANEAENILKKIQTLKELGIIPTPHQEESHIILYSIPAINYALTHFVKTYSACNSCFINLHTIDGKDCLERLLEIKEPLSDGVYFLANYDKNNVSKILNNENFICKKIQEDQFCLLVGKSHPLNAYTTVSLSSIRKYKIGLYSMNDSPENPFLQAIFKNNIPKIDLCTDNMDLLIDALKNNRVVVPAGHFIFKSQLVNHKDISALHIKSSEKTCLYCVFSKKYYEKNRSTLNYFLEHFEQYLITDVPL